MKETETTSVRGAFEFSERLSPILVKELRQGLRSPAFVSSSIGLQVVLCLGFLLLYIYDGNPSGGGPADMLLALSLALPMLVIFPARALPSIRQEVEHRSLELLQLTALSPWRIAFAKWLSIVCQALLFELSVLPLIPVRFLFGQSTMREPWNLIVLLPIGCALLTALMLLVSGAPQLFYLLGILAGLMAALLCLFFTISATFDAMPGLSFGGGWLLVWAALVSAFVVAVLLVGVARRLSAGAHNYAGVQRLLPLVLLVPWCVGWVLPSLGRELLQFWSLALWALLSLAIAMYETCDGTKPVYAHVRAWARGGHAARVLRTLLLPGWWSSALWFLAVALVWACAATATQPDRARGIFAGAIMAAAAILSARAVSLLCGGRLRTANWLPLAFLVLTFGVGLIQLSSNTFTGLAGAPVDSIPWSIYALSLVPAAGLGASLHALTRPEVPLALLVTGLVQLFVCLGIFRWRASGESRAIAALIQEARQ